MRRTCSRWLLVLLLVAAPMLMLVHAASANTEMVPAARLVAPLVDVTPGRNTIFLLVNASGTIDLLGGVGGNGGVHLEFYDKTCSTTSRTQFLSRLDIDALGLASLIVLPSNVGWADIDVRAVDATVSDTSLERNVLMGTGIVADFSSDFAIAYPMAASLGSSSTGVGGSIVTRTPAGAANVWSGRYEAYPSRVNVPFFWADGNAISGATFTSRLVIAAPADGNWDGSSPTVAGSEAPGQALPGSVVPADGALIAGTARFHDACEQSFDKGLRAHFIHDSLTTLFTALLADQANWVVGPPPTAQPCRDEVTPPTGGRPVGWIEVPNTLLSGTGGAPTRARGMVGLFIESAASAPLSLELGVASRLWGHRGSITRQLNCTTSANVALPGNGEGAATCWYNMINNASNIPRTTDLP